MNLKIFLAVIILAGSQSIEARLKPDVKSSESFPFINQCSKAPEIKIDSSYFVKNNGRIDVY